MEAHVYSRMLQPEIQWKWLSWPRLDELASQEASLRLKEQLLQQEKQLVESQNRWLSDELEAKSTQLLELRKEKANTVAELEGKLNSSQEEVCVYMLEREIWIS